jgi:hypothetical protein
VKKFLTITLLTLSLINISFAAGDGARYPKNPNLVETPGKLCSRPTTIRYPEKIAYCERDVDSYTKNSVIQKYDSMFSYSIRQMNRGEFKIDHMIPLCVGGANSEDNLWPQHKSVYVITDPLEPLVCEKMAAGKLKQAEAIKIILQAKMNLNQVQAIIKQVRSL